MAAKVKKYVGKNYRDLVLKSNYSNFVLFWDSKNLDSVVEYEKNLDELIKSIKPESIEGKLEFGKIDLNLNEVKFCVNLFNYYKKLFSSKIK